MQNSVKPRIAISTLGCKTNFFESAAIAERFGEVELVDFAADADVYIINTCTVTNRTDYKSRNLIRKALARKADLPNAKVVVTGCFAQRSAQEIAELGPVDLIVDNQSKLDIAELLAGKANTFTDIMEAEDFAYRPVSSMLSHTRAFHKIQDGCDFYCAYCAVPYARGHSRSAHFSDVLEQAQIFAENGFKEIVLGGVNLGLYKDGERDLADVVEGISAIQKIELIRISSIEPQLLYDGLLDRLSKYPKLCPHFHIPLQSGSDEMLKNMGRRYDTALIQRLVQRILELYPDAAIGFDTICGFPGESEAHFQETLTLLSGLPIAYLHVFSYSKRKGTRADTMSNQIPGKIKNARARELTELSLRKKHEYAEKLIHRKVCLKGVNEASEQDRAETLSDHYLRVRLASSAKQGTLIACNIADCEIVFD
jgi:threonylcarbamoyladenosine tRNA methylthiotransferase MtaB